MGWSLDILQDTINKVFGAVEHEVVRPDSIRPTVYFSYAGEITLVQKRKLVSLFPDDIFVIFHPNSLGEDVKEGPSPLSNFEDKDGK